MLQTQYARAIARMNPTLADRILKTQLKAPWIFADELKQNPTFLPPDFKNLTYEKTPEGVDSDFCSVLRSFEDKVRTFFEENPEA